IFATTIVMLSPFAILQMQAGNPIIAIAQFSGLIALVIGVFRIGSSPHLRRWILIYLLLLYSFLTAVMFLPNASDTAYVWVLMMPVLAYLLLGRWPGLA